jgi:hypothetical protein
MKIVCLTTILVFICSYSQPIDSYDPCIYVSSTNSNSTIDICLKAGDCCAFQFSYDVDFTSNQKIDFYSCVSKKILKYYNMSDYKTVYLSGIEDADVQAQLKSTLKVYGTGCSSRNLITSTVLLLFLIFILLF